MAKELTPIKIFNLAEAYAGGGTYFKDGTYRCELARFVDFDFNQTDGDTACCLQLTLQPLNASLKEEGEPVVQHWPLDKKGDGSYKPIQKGKAVAAIGEYPTIWKLCDFSVFMEHLAKAEFDMDSYEEDGDISVLEGGIWEMGLYTKPGQAAAKKADDDEDGKGKGKGKAKTDRPYQVVVVTSIPKKGKAGKKKEEEEDEKPKKKGSKKEEEEPDANTKLGEYLEKELLVKKNEDGIAVMQARMGITKFMKGEDNDLIKEVVALFNDKKVITPILKAAGWEIDGNEIKLSE